MEEIDLDNPPRFLTHHLLLRPDCLARLTLPTNLTQQEAKRLSAFLDVLVVDADDDDEQWPFDADADPDDDLDPDEIQSSEDELYGIDPISSEDIAAFEKATDEMALRHHDAAATKP